MSERNGKTEVEGDNGTAASRKSHLDQSYDRSESSDDRNGGWNRGRPPSKTALRNGDDNFVREENRTARNASADGRDAGEEEELDESFDRISDLETAERFKNLLILIFFTGLTVVNYILPNVKLVLKYSEAAENDRYVRMTLAYMIAPIFITSLISLAWYIDDDLKAKDDGKQPASRKTWWLRGLVLLLQMGTVLRYAQSLVYGYRSKHTQGIEKARNARKMALFERDATLLKSCTSFLQGVPQFALQLYILTNGPENILRDGVFWQVLSLAGCVGSVSWATVSCDRILIRETQGGGPASQETDWMAIAILVPWRVFAIASRLTILALFTTLHPFYFGIGCVGHYLVMFSLIQRWKVDTRHGTRAEVFLFLVGGLVFLVTDLLTKYERSRDSHGFLLYYGINLVEGVVMMGVWYAESAIGEWYKRLVIIGVSVTFVLGILFLRVFYEYSRPHSARPCFTFCRKQLKSRPVKTESDGSEVP